MGRARPWPRNLPKSGNKLFLFGKKNYIKERGKKKKKSSFGWEDCFHSQEELFKLANTTWPVDPFPFIFLLACLPPPWERLKEGKEQTDVPGLCWWGFRDTSELLVSLQSHPAGNGDSQLGHEGLAINLGR